MFIVTAFACTTLIYKTWLKWKTNPVIISFDEKMSSISQIPFPAVTICPEQKISLKKYNTTKFLSKHENAHFNNMTKEE